ncbi:MAG: GTP cyclohydrolase II [Campylobacterales bacterium]
MKISTSQMAKLPTRFGHFQVQAFREGDKEHLVIRTPHLCEIPLVRVHSECLTGDAIGSLRCDCRDQLNEALKMIDQTGCGMVIYLRQEGRGIGLLNKINAYHLQDNGLDTVEANHQLGFPDDLRSYEIVDYILHYYGVTKIRLLTNNPSKLEKIKGVKIVERVPLVIPPNEHNAFYLATKKEKSRHIL